MKFFSILCTICMYLATANAQKIDYESIRGTWQYKSPKGKSKLVYKFDIENKFSSVLERDETELATEGTYEFDKKNDLDRLILTSPDKSNSARTLITYHLIKALGSDTIKLQHVSIKQATWEKENRRNTMTFVRNKEKEKPKE